MMRVKLILFAVISSVVGLYEPNWTSLDTRPLPQWYDDAKFGIFIHWGVFSVPSFGTEWFWKNWNDMKLNYVEFMKANYPPNFTYADFARDFTAEFYDPYEWAKLFNSSGAKYVVLTSKHHEGYTLWPSKYSFSWNSVDVGPKRDLLGDLAKALRETTDITFGLYHSLFEWFNPLYLQDKKNWFLTRDFVNTKTMPELYELVETYKPEVIWSDGEWEALDIYWNSTGFIAWLYNYSPVKDTVVVNDRWGSGILCKHGDFYTCEDRYVPGKLVNHKWESCMTLDKKSWGYRRNAKLEDYLSIEDVVGILVETVSNGGNLLLNVGPTHDGRIPVIMEERLVQIGQWLEINGEAIYKTKPWLHQNDRLSKTTWYTQSKDSTTVYGIALEWPDESALTLANIKPHFSSVDMLGGPSSLTWSKDSGHVTVKFPCPLELQTKWAYVLRFNNYSSAANQLDSE